MSAVSEREAVEKLITVLDDDNIALKPLAQDVQKVPFLTHSLPNALISDLIHIFNPMVFSFPL